MDALSFETRLDFKYFASPLLRVFSIEQAPYMGQTHSLTYFEFVRPLDFIFAFFLLFVRSVSQ